MKNILTMLAIGAVFTSLGSGVEAAKPPSGPTLEQRVAALEALTATQSNQILALQTQTVVLTGQIEGISTTSAQTTVVVLPANDFMTFASLNLPAGNYLLSGQVNGRPYSSAASLIGIGCQMRASTVDYPIGWGQATLLSYYFQIDPIGSVALPDGGTVWIQCRTDNYPTVIVDNTVLIATRVPTLD